LGSRTPYFEANGRDPRSLAGVECMRSHSNSTHSNIERCVDGESQTRLVGYSVRSDSHPARHG